MEGHRPSRRRLPMLMPLVVPAVHRHRLGDAQSRDGATPAPHARYASLARAHLDEGKLSLAGAGRAWCHRSPPVCALTESDPALDVLRATGSHVDGGAARDLCALRLPQIREAILRRPPALQRLTHEGEITELRRNVDRKEHGNVPRARPLELVDEIVGH